MLTTDKAALICDLAEVYNIYDYHRVPVSLLGTLASGLGPNSRIGMKLSGRKASIETILLAKIYDLFTAYVYSWSETDKRPEPLLDTFLDKKDVVTPKFGYQSGDDFKAAWANKTQKIKEQSSRR